MLAIPATNPVAIADGVTYTYTSTAPTLTTAVTGTGKLIGFKVALTPAKIVAKAKAEFGKIITVAAPDKTIIPAGPTIDATALGHLNVHIPTTTGVTTTYAIATANGVTTVTATITSTADVNVTDISTFTITNLISQDKADVDAVTLTQINAAILAAASFTDQTDLAVSGS